jgi:hypothetical protein
VSVQAPIRANAPSVNGGRWSGAYRALDYQRFVYGSLSRLERGGGDGAEVSLGTVNVKGLHGVRVGLVGSTWHDEPE